MVRHGIRGFQRDAYHNILDLTWWKLLFASLLVYWGIVFAFAALYYWVDGVAGGVFFSFTMGH